MFLDGNHDEQLERLHGFGHGVFQDVDCNRPPANPVNVKAARLETRARPVFPFPVKDSMRSVFRRKTRY